MPNLTGSYLRDRLNRGREKRSKGLNRVTHRIEDNDAYPKLLQILLKLQGLILRHKDLKSPVRSGRQKSTITHAAPPLALHRAHIMPRQLVRELTRKLLIKQNSHAKSRPREPPPELPLPAHELP